MRYRGYKKWDADTDTDINGIRTETNMSSLSFGGGAIILVVQGDWNAKFGEDAQADWGDVCGP